MIIGTVNVAGLEAMWQGLGDIAQLRDDALAEYSAAVRAEKNGFQALSAMTIALPKAAQADLDKKVPAEAALIGLFSPVLAIRPVTTERAVERGQKLVSVLNKTNAYLAGLVPPRPPVTAAGKGVAQLDAAIEAQPALVQTVDDRDADARSARADLHGAADVLDRLNKRFYSRLVAEAGENAALRASLSTITTEGKHRPATLRLRSISQGGVEDGMVLVGYATASFRKEFRNSLEWMVADGGKKKDTRFSNRIPADRGGNTIGPFEPGATVKLRTRVTNANGTTTGSVRTLKIAGG